MLFSLFRKDFDDIYDYYEIEEHHRMVMGIIIFELIFYIFLGIITLIIFPEFILGLLITYLALILLNI